ncbi:GGDEF domain-containing protein [Metabacillus fastidiosus]|uniref:GGDEF domain-containing protein n=1 Tax=Metabacillus fastidiosus TaxID=1458 RepID=A0ABU6NVE5_9BACI|nr:GGDEF domain-containing protein [Metabacillus fastidiosus]MED4400337.1 GGDEF domain-containing protein [Metabacillus fastidiosus]
MFANQLYLLPLSFSMIVVLLMAVMVINLYLKTRKRPYLIGAAAFVLALIPVVSVSFSSIKGDVVLTSPLISLLLVSLTLVQGGVYHLYSSKKKKELLVFLSTIILIFIFGMTSNKFISVIPYILIIAFSIMSYYRLMKDINNRMHYLLTLSFTFLSGIFGALAVVFNSSICAFMFSSFLTMAFIIQFLMFFERIVDLMQAASYTSITDPLTGLFNRRFYTKLVEQKGEKGYIGVIFCDIDNFKKLNDTHGHKKGDEVLKQVAWIVQETVSGKGIGGRYGGEEIVLLIDQEHVDIAAVAEKIRSRVEKESIVTLSIGYATNDGITPSETINKADKFMYQAKNSGKNKVCG